MQADPNIKMPTSEHAWACLRKHIFAPRGDEKTAVQMTTIASVKSILEDAALKAQQNNIGSVVPPQLPVGVASMVTRPIKLLIYFGTKDVEKQNKKHK